jgi:branched-chain amino acid transport system permease protein
VVQVIASGLANGCVYALVTLGFVLIYNGSGAVNFSQGALVVAGGILLAWMTSSFALPYALALLLAVLGLAAFGWLYHRLAVQPLRRQPADAVFVSTIGMTVGLQNLALALWGPDPQTVPSAFAFAGVRVAGASLSPQVLVVFGVTLCVLVLFHLLMFRTRMGRGLRATAEDPEAAELVGVPTARSIGLLFMIGIGLAALAGGLFAPFVFLTVGQGNHFLLMCFVAAVVGGFGSPAGAVVGSLVVGVAEAVVGVYLTSAYQDAVIFAAIIALLAFRPQGLFGERVAVKA